MEKLPPPFPCITCAVTEQDEGTALSLAATILLDPNAALAANAARSSDSLPLALLLPALADIVRREAEEDNVELHIYAAVWSSAAAFGREFVDYKSRHTCSPWHASSNQSRTPERKRSIRNFIVLTNPLAGTKAKMPARPAPETRPLLPSENRPAQ